MVTLLVLDSLGFGAVKEQADQDAGFTLAVGIGTATQTAGASMRMQYQYGTNKLVCYKVESGVRTKLGESTSALDGIRLYLYGWRLIQNAYFNHRC